MTQPLATGASLYSKFVAYKTDGRDVGYTSWSDLDIALQTPWNKLADFVNREAKVWLEGQPNFRYGTTALTDEELALVLKNREPKPEPEPMSMSEYNLLTEFLGPVLTTLVLQAVNRRKP